VTAAGDAELLATLTARDIALDLCPTSNVQAGIVASIADHPVVDLHRRGVVVTVSTDDRTVTGITLSEELARCVRDLGATPAELAAIALEGFRRGFAPAILREPLIGEATDAWTSWAANAAIS